MNYTLTTRRMVNGTWQVVQVAYDHANTEGASAYTQKCLPWVSAIVALDAGAWSSGSLIKDSFIEQPGATGSNTGSKADIMLTIRSKSANSANLVMLEIRDVALANVSARYTALVTEYNVTYSDWMIVSAVIDLHD